MPARRKLNIVICDDEKDVEAAIKTRIPQSIEATCTLVPDIGELTKTLQKRVTEVRKRKPDSNSAKFDEAVVDRADIFIVDYDLIKAKNAEYVTGEGLAYLARCYSTCGIIVSLNQFARSPTFDLTLCAAESFADLNISLDDIGNRGLWFEDRWPKFRPWIWPVLPTLATRFNQRIKELDDADLETPIATFFGFPQSALERITTSAWEQLSPRRGKPSETVLGDVLLSPKLGMKGREGFQRRKVDKLNARIVAARLAAWLQSILVAQDVLVDAPHLVARCPSLLGDHHKTIDLKKLCEVGAPGQGPFGRKLAQAAFAKRCWFDRPVWYWTEIERLRLVAEAQEPWNVKPLELVFCEDTSKFVRKADAKIFQSNLSSSYRTRYVEVVGGINYQPLHRLAMG